MRLSFILSTILLFFASTTWAQTTVTWGNGNTRTETRHNAGDFGNGVMSGFYETWDAASSGTYPPGANSWWHLLDVRHSNSANNFAMPFSGSFFDQNLFFRKTINNSTAAWSRVVLEDPNGKVGISRLLTHSLAYLDGDRFGYNGYSINHYGLEWNDDAWYVGGQTAWLSGYAGIKQFTGGQCRLAITNGGNVGIGTATPQELLSVNGTIASKRIRVTQSGWPDYVFSQNYNLRKLDAVATYIQRHKHLPDVPAAAEITKGGLDLGENQAVLLRKVEELTLYVIQLNTAVNQLKAENKQQKRIITRLAHKK